MVSPEEIRRAGLGVSGRSISCLTSAQRLQVARAGTLLPREKRAFLQRVVFHLRPAFAVAPSDADVEAAIAAAYLALTQHGETAVVRDRNPSRRSGTPRAVRILGTSGSKQ
jgi:hypothetical protein